MPALPLLFRLFRPNPRPPRRCDPLPRCGRRSARAAAAPAGEIDEQEELLKQKGLAHEQRYLDSLIAQGVQVTQIPTDATLDRQIAATLAA